MRLFLKPLLFLLFFVRNVHMAIYYVDDSAGASTQNYVFWPNATIPFYIVPEHFDREQSTSIMTTLALIAFKSCLKFLPVLATPEPNQHVLVIANPDGVRQCAPTTTGHSFEQPHTVILGYDCLRPPHIEMMLMKALGFPFEHNRASRDIFIEVQFENIDPNAMDMFTKDNSLPLELRSLAYDIDSVMHFGERDYSKNGHRTIIFKDRANQPVKQNRVGLTALDLRKIEIVYGPECRKRDRQEKIELCQNYPGVARKKREVLDITNLRVNRDITPPPRDISEHVNNSLRELGIENEVQDVVDQVYKVSSKALSNARAKYCNGSKGGLRISEEKVIKNGSSDILGIIETIANYARNMVDNAVANLTEFCRSSENIELYQLARGRCPFFGARECPPSYKSTKSGAVRYSTQHRPVIIQSTKHDGKPYKSEYVHRAVNDTESVTAASRRKRHVEVSEDKNKKETKARKDEETTTITSPRRSENDTNSESAKVGNSSNAVLRSNTDRPEVNRVNYVARHRRKSFKVKHGGRSPKEWDDSKVSTENKEREGEEITKREKQFFKGIKKIVRGMKSKDVRKRHKSRIPRESESAEESPNLDEVAEGSPNLDDVADERPNHDEVAEERPRHDKVAEKRPNHEEVAEESPNLDEISEESPNLGDTVEESPKLGDVAEESPNLGNGPKTVKLSKENQEFYDDRKWPEKVIPYILIEDPKYDLSDVRHRIAEVNSILKKKTCVKLKEITEKEAENYEDYLVVDTSPDYVTGRVGGRQNFGSLELYRGGQHRQHAAMVAMAMLGFYFELARHDRDKHVRVHLRHVRPDKLHHFEKIRADATLPLPYDYESATHPAWQFWRKIGITGISTVATFKSKDPKGNVMKSLGQHEKLLSDIDIVKINSVYGIECFQDARLRSSGKKKHASRKRE